jgi:hypothetical protein
MNATIPPLTGAEFQFFEQNELVQAYESDKNYQNTQVEPLANEPGLLLHEFILLLGRICANCKTTSDKIHGNIKDFFDQDIFRRMELKESKAALSASESEEEGMLDESEEELDEQQKQFMDFLAQKASQEKDFEFDEEEIKSELDALLPAIPGKPNV